MVNLLTAAEDNSIIKSSEDKAIFQKVDLNRRVGEIFSLKSIYAAR
jgi:hypothetical protein